MRLDVADFAMVAAQDAKAGEVVERDSGLAQFGRQIEQPAPISSVFLIRVWSIALMLRMKNSELESGSGW